MADGAAAREAGRRVDRREVAPLRSVGRDVPGGGEADVFEVLRGRGTDIVDTGVSESVRGLKGRRADKSFGSGSETPSETPVVGTRTLKTDTSESSRGLGRSDRKGVEDYGDGKVGSVPGTVDGCRGDGSVGVGPEVLKRWVQCWTVRRGGVGPGGLELEWGRGWASGRQVCCTWIRHWKTEVLETGQELGHNVKRQVC